MFIIKTQRELVSSVLIALRLTVLLTLFTGLLYPGIITLISQLFFPFQAKGSLLVYNGKIIGSALIGQEFSEEKYFWGRLSATTRYPYNASSSSGSNIGPTNPALLRQAKMRMESLGNQAQTPIPIDLLTASGSGLDPEISPKAALYQTQRIANARGIPVQKIRELVKRHIQYPQFRFSGESRVNVLQLNIALDEISKTTS